MQDLLIVKNDRVIVQASNQLYDERFETFILDGGVSLPGEIIELDYNKTNESCWINGKAFQAFPHEYAESVLALITTLISNKEMREREQAEQEEAERMANMTEEEKEAQALEQAKVERSDAVGKITVEVDGMTFDGNEVSQQRMARCVMVMNDGESISWVLADNSVAVVTKEQLKKVLSLAVVKQSELWVVPYK